jgi:hypothetical protein
MNHAFAVGQTVTLAFAHRRQAPPGYYKVVRLLPDRQYRIKSVSENNERVVRENELRFSSKSDVFARPRPRDVATARVIEECDV